jgi:hypothetical protein
MTGIVVVRTLATGLPSVEGENTLCVVMSVNNDRGAPNVPVLVSGVDEVRQTMGGFTPFLGEGPLTGYDGNGYRQMHKLRAGSDLVIQPVDLAVKDKTASDATAVDQLVILTRTTVSTSVRTLPAGTRLADAAIGAATACVALLEDVVWDIGDVSAKSVRVREVSSAVSGVGGTPALLSSFSNGVSDMDTLIDEPALDASEAITINTTATTTIDDLDAAELLVRYQAAFDALDQYEEGLAARILVCDKNLGTIGDALSAHCETLSLQGYFRKCVLAPPVGTTAALARTGSSTASVNRGTLKQEQVISYVHPFWRVASPDLDVDNLTGPKYNTLLAPQIHKAFLTSHFLPEDNASQYRSIVGNPLISGVESTPDRGIQERANICQPVLDRTPGQSGLVATYHSDVSAYVKDGNDVYAYTLRMADHLTEAIVVILAYWHKKPASVTNQEEAAAAVGRLLEQYLIAERIGAYAEPTYNYNSEAGEYTLRLEVRERGNLDKITLFFTFGPGVTFEEAA